MPYALAVTHTAADDLDRLIQSLRPEQRPQALDAINNICTQFGLRPQHRRGSPLSPPTFPIHFEVAGTRFYWAATYRISEDETTLVITHMFRVLL